MTEPTIDEQIAHQRECAESAKRIFKPEEAAMHVAKLASLERLKSFAAQPEYKNVPMGPVGATYIGSHPVPEKQEFNLIDAFNGRCPFPAPLDAQPVPVEPVKTVQIEMRERGMVSTTWRDPAQNYYDQQTIDTHGVIKFAALLQREMEAENSELREFAKGLWYLLHGDMQLFDIAVQSAIDRARSANDKG